MNANNNRSASPHHATDGHDWCRVCSGRGYVWEDHDDCENCDGNGFVRLIDPERSQLAAIHKAANAHFEPRRARHQEASE